MASGAFSHRKQITIDPARVSGPSDLTDFPALISLNDPDLRATGNGGKVQNANGYDVVFRGEDGYTALDHEVEAYDGANGTLLAWVRIPTLRTSQGTVLYVYYGDPTISTSQENPSGVWSSIYRGVWHLGEDPTGPAPQFLDSTANANDGTANSLTAANQVPGQIEGSLVFDDTNERHVSVAHHASLQLATDISVSTWLKISDGDPDTNVIFAKWGSSGNRNYWLGKLNNTTWGFFVNDTESVQNALGTINDNVWHHVLGVADSSTGRLKLYVDGVEVSDAAYTGSSQTGTAPFHIGSSPDVPTQEWSGGADEVRVAAAAFSPDWIQTEYNNQSSPSTFYWIGSEEAVGSCPPLSATEGTGTFTVTAPDSFEIVFDQDVGGGIREFYDLVEDPSRAADLVGTPGSGIPTLHHSAVLSNSVWYSPADNTGSTGSPTYNHSPPRFHVLEVTPTRVRVRQESFFQQNGGTGALPGVKLFGDYSVYPSGRIGLRWNRRVAGTVGFSDQDLAIGMRVETSCPPAPDGLCNNLDPYMDTGPLPPAPGPPWGTPDTDFLFAQREAAGVRTDFLHVLYQDWPLADRSEFEPTVGFLNWRDVTAGNLGANDLWNFMTFFKPTDLGATANPWEDPAVTGRSAGYRNPDALAVTIGSPWIDAAENTASNDDFNESEGAYVLTFDPANGLTFDMDGLATTRHTPFFKIRQWRSLNDPVSVTLEGVALVNDVDFRADVKPISHSGFASDVLFHTTLHGSAAVTAPDVGDGTGAAENGVSYVAARYGNGALFDADGERIDIPLVVNGRQNLELERGRIEFWYQPNYEHADDAQHYLLDLDNDGANGGVRIKLKKEGSGFSNVLRVEIVDGGANLHAISIPSTSYRWSAGDWVHVALSWDGGDTTDNIDLYLNGVELTPSAENDTPFTMEAESAVGKLRIGMSVESCCFNADGIFDELTIYGAPGAPDRLAFGGLRSNASEYLASGTRNYDLGFTTVDPERRGRYLYLGADSKFRGVNVALAREGAGTPDLQWQFWNGEAWTDLEAVPGFNDETNHLSRDGTIYWTSDPFNWSAYSVAGGPDLYYVRAYLASGSYTTTPIEGLVKTDILLFGYCGDVTADGQTFEFALNATTAVELVSFVARGLDGEVELFWETGSEMGNLGFHLYRSLREEGPFARITARPIPGLGSSPSGAAYRYRDGGLTNERTYYYRLEDIDASGRTELHGPVAATPRAGAPAADPPSEDDPPAGVIAYGEPRSSDVRVLERERDRIVLELRTGGFYAEPQADGTLRLSIPGFDDDGTLPTRRSWVEVAAAGRKVDLVSIRATEIEVLPGLEPSPSSAELEASGGGTIRATSRAGPRGRGRAASPAWARLLEIGFQGEVKKALVELSPLRWEAASRRLLFARRIEIVLAFHGREPTERVLSRTRARREQRARSHSRRSGVVKRLATVAPGLYAVRFEDVLGSAPAVSAEELRLSRGGEPVAYRIEPRPDVFAPGSTLYFLSEGERVNPHDREAVYEIELRAPGVRMPEIASDPGGVPLRVYRARLEREENRYYQAGLLDAPDVWLWDAVFAPESKQFPFEVSRLALAPEQPARITVWFQGASDSPAGSDHHVRIRVNGFYAGEATWDGKTPERLEADLPAGALVEGTNVLEIENVGDAGASYSMVMLDRFEVVYSRQAVAAAGRLSGTWTRSGTAEVAEISAPVYVLDVTQEPPRWVSHRLTTASGVSFAVEEGRSYVLVSEDALLRPEVRIPLPSSLRDDRNQADYLAIGPRAFLEAAAPLIDLRRREGLRVRAVPIEEVFSEFGHGEPSPEALRDFLSHAYHRWRSPSYRYVLLLGDATYDPKDYLQTGVVSQVPAAVVRSRYLWTASDPLYASVNGEDRLPDVALGRIPAATVEEVRVLVDKILSYESGGDARDAPVFLVADDPDSAGDFTRNAEELAATVLSSRAPEKIYLEVLGGEEAQRAIRAAFSQGASLLSYIGHGGIHLWADEKIFHSGEVSSLPPQPRQPLLLTMNCLNGYFHFPYFDSLSEKLLKAEATGAIAAFSPSGLSLDEPAHRYHRALLEEIAGGRHDRLGDAVLAAQAEYAESGAFPDLLAIYHLFGDPALRLHR